MQGIASVHGFWELLTGDEQRDLMALGRDKKYPPGTTLCVEGDPATHVFVLLDGWVKILSVTDDGHENVLALLGGGDIAGETAGATTGHRNATMQAIGTVHALIVGYDRFGSFLDTHAGADRAYRRMMTQRWSDVGIVLRTRAVTSGAQRLAGLLLDLAGQHGSRAGGAIEVALPLSQEELASMTGTSRATVTRALSNWRKRGFIRTGQCRITIIEPLGLRQAAGPAIGLTRQLAATRARTGHRSDISDGNAAPALAPIAAIPGTTLPWRSPAGCDGNMPDAPNTLPLLRLGRLELDPGLRALQPGQDASGLVVTATVEVPDSGSEPQYAWDVALADAAREASKLGADERTAQALAAGAGKALAGGTGSWSRRTARCCSRGGCRTGRPYSVRVGPLPHLLETAAFAARRPAHVVVLADRDGAAVIAHAAGDQHPARRFRCRQARSANRTRTGRPRCTTGSGT